MILPNKVNDLLSLCCERWFKISQLLNILLDTVDGSEYPLPRLCGDTIAQQIPNK